MEYQKMLELAIETLRTRGFTLEKHYAYYEGRHDSNLGTKAWNDNFRRLLSGVIDNLCGQAIDSLAEDVAPESVEALSEDPLDLADALWATEFLNREASKINQAMVDALISSEPVGLIVDVNLKGQPCLYRIDPRELYVHMNRGGEVLWIAHVWRENEKEAYTSATIYVPGGRQSFVSTSKDRLPSFTSFVPSGPFEPSGSDEIPVSVIDLRTSILDRIIPSQDLLNKNLQLQAMSGEAYAMPLRIYLGIETYDPETGEINAVIPELNAATGSRDVSIPTVQDAEGGKREVIQLNGASPDIFLAQAESYRAAIANHAHRPAYTLQLGGAQPASGEALEIAWADAVKWKRSTEKVHVGPWITEALQKAVQLRRRLVTGSAGAAPALKVNFVAPAVNSTSSRTDNFVKAVGAGMTLSDALVEFMGFSREAADQAQLKSEEGSLLAAEAQAASFERGIEV